MKPILAWVLGGAALFFAAAVGLVLAQPYTLRGSAIVPPAPAPEIALGDYRLSAEQGKVVMLAFGYTTCPDICPATLGEFKQVLEGLGKDAENVQMLFITVDPARDTPERMDAYTAAFDPRIRGLSGSEEELQAVWGAYGVTRIIREVGSKAGYLVDHSTRIYVVDGAGNLRATYAFGTPVADLVSDLRFLVRESR